VIESNTLHVKEIVKIYLIEQNIYPSNQDKWYVYHSALSRYVSDCNVCVTSKTKHWLGKKLNRYWYYIVLMLYKTMFGNM
jgi:hypothetical protein